MYGYAKAMEVLDLLDASTPLCAHGEFSHYTPNGQVGIADYRYQGFPNSSGGAVTHQGQFIGIHASS